MREDCSNLEALPPIELTVAAGTTLTLPPQLYVSKVTDDDDGAEVLPAGPFDFAGPRVALVTLCVPASRPAGRTARARARHARTRRHA